MDIYSVISCVCDQAADLRKQLRGMSVWYLFSDKRPGTVTERFERDRKFHRMVNGGVG